MGVPEQHQPPERPEALGHELAPDSAADSVTDSLTDSLSDSAEPPPQDARQDARQDAWRESPEVPRSSGAARDHLANERTLLAWSRTAIAVMGLGFVVARFGLLIRELGGHLSRGLPAGTSTVFGTLLVVVGALLLLLALLRYLHAGRAIDEGRYRWSPLLGILLAGSLLVAGVLLAVYLLITA